MRRFPNPAFSLTDKAGDANLVRYLTEPGSVSFLEERTRDELRELRPSELRKQSNVLVKVWPHILADALLALKFDDKREAGRLGAVQRRSLFHEASLGIAELEKVLKGFTGFESMLYGLSPDRYRDHIAHVFRVWVLGQGLLGGELNWQLETDVCRREDGSEIAFGQHISRTEIECMWALAALCHDIGYPLAAVEKINERTRVALGLLGLSQARSLQFAFSQQALPFHDTILRLISSRPVCVASKPADEGGRKTLTTRRKKQEEKHGEYRYLTHLQHKYYLKFMKSFDRLDHGVVSAVLLSRALVYFLESELCHDDRGTLSEDEARQFVIRRDILRAIAAHTCPDIYHIKFNTLAFFLFVVDELQCWGRPTFEEIQAPSEDLRRDSVVVRRYGRDEIIVEIVESVDKWNKASQEAIEARFGRLHQMVRMSIDTPRISPSQRLEFIVRNRGGEKAAFLLHRKRIRKFLPWKRSKVAGQGKAKGERSAKRK